MSFCCAIFRNLMRAVEVTAKQIVSQLVINCPTLPSAHSQTWLYWVACQNLWILFALAERMRHIFMCDFHFPIMLLFRFYFYFLNKDIPFYCYSWRANVRQRTAELLPKQSFMIKASQLDGWSSALGARRSFFEIELHVVWERILGASSKIRRAKRIYIWVMRKIERERKWEWEFIENFYQWAFSRVLQKVL